VVGGLLSGAKVPQRSLLWLALAAAGPFGFIAISMLRDRAPAPEDLYQQFIRKLKMYWRVPLEIAVFVFGLEPRVPVNVLKRDLMIRYESFSTGNVPSRRSSPDRTNPAASTHLARGWKFSTSSY
jgi:hypothetical protein